jgi:hypothetical protein
MIKQVQVLIVLLATSLWAQSTHAVTATLTGDSFTVSTSASANKGKTTTLQISGPPDSTTVKTAYVKFDLSTLPPSVTAADISKATLTLFASSVTKDGSFDVQRVASAWTEATITTGSAPTLGVVEQSAVPVATTDKNQYKVIDVTNVVKAWRDGSLTNNGMALVANAVDGLNAKFDSKESTAHSQVPRLEITLSASAGAGTVTNVSAASPLSVTNGTTTPNITLATVPITLGGTNATSAVAARTNLGAAASGTNSDITSLSGLTAPLSVAQGGTGAATATGARNQLGAAASGFNGDINALTGLSGNIEFFFLTSPDASTGNILKGGQRFLHNFGGNTFLGINAGNFNFTLTGTGNSGLGSGTLSNATSGSNNTAVGSSALFGDTSGSDNTAVGFSALQSNSTGVSNTAVGRDSLISLTTGNENTAVGQRALRLMTTGTANTAVGKSALENNTANFNTGLGYFSLLSNTTAGFNTAVGAFSQQFVSSGGENTAVGFHALRQNTMGGQNTAVGNGALENNTGGDNTAVGYLALLNNTSGTPNTAVGREALKTNTTGGRNSALGYKALFANTTGFDNTAMGYSTLSANGAAGANTAVGSYALSESTGSNNSAVGYAALPFNTSGFRNLAFGSGALFGNTTGALNTALGYQALANSTDGYDNIAVGDSAGTALTTERDNIDIGNPGVAGEDKAIRIGFPGTHTKAFIAGIRGVTTGVADGIAVLIDSNGQLGTISSSRRFKTDIRDMTDASSKLMRLRPVTFKYKPEIDHSGSTQYGLIAEEVEEVFPDLVARDKDGKIETVKYHLLSVLLVNELQKQYREQRAQADEIRLLRAQSAQLVRLQKDNTELLRDNATLHLRLQNVEQVVQRLATTAEPNTIDIAARP